MSTKADICGANTRDGRCLNAPINGTGRCRLHGGASTGPRTPEGRQKNSDALKARWLEINQALAMARASEGART